MNDEQMDAWLIAAAEADAGLEAPARVEAALVRAYRDAHGAPAPARAGGLQAVGDWLWAGLAAAAAVVAIAATLRAPAAPSLAAAEEEAEFLPLAGAAAGFEDVEAMQVVAIEMPRVSLAGIGYVGPLVAGDGEAVRAELLVGNDGIARGIRFVR